MFSVAERDDEPVEVIARFGAIIPGADDFPLRQTFDDGQEERAERQRLEIDDVFSERIQHEGQRCDVPAQWAAAAGEVTDDAFDTRSPG